MVANELFRHPYTSIIITENQTLHTTRTGPTNNSEHIGCKLVIWQFHFEYNGNKSQSKCIIESRFQEKSTHWFTVVTFSDMFMFITYTVGRVLN